MTVRDRVATTSNRRRPERAERTAAELNSTAHHEAGHAVALVAQRLGFESVTIVPEGTSLGRCTHPSIPGYEGPHSIRSDRSLARKLIVVSYAGDPAQRLVDSAPPDYAADVDNDDAWELSCDYGVLPRGSRIGDDAYKAYLEELKSEARRLVGRHERAIRALAAVLLAEQTMTECRVIEVVRPFFSHLQQEAESQIE